MAGCSSQKENYLFLSVDEAGRLKNAMVYGGSSEDISVREFVVVDWDMDSVEYLKRDDEEFGNGVFYRPSSSLSEIINTLFNDLEGVDVDKLLESWPPLPDE